MKSVHMRDLDKLAERLFGFATPFGISGADIYKQGKASWTAIAHGPEGELRVWGANEGEVKRKLRDAMEGLIVLRKCGRLIAHVRENDTQWNIEVHVTKDVT